MYLSGNDGNSTIENRHLKTGQIKLILNLKKPTESDVLMLVEHLKEQEKSALWITRYLSAILLLRNKLTKPFRYCSKNI